MAFMMTKGSWLLNETSYIRAVLWLDKYCKFVYLTLDKKLFNVCLINNNISDQHYWLTCLTTSNYGKLGLSLPKSCGASN